jgi:hypothetical protein
VGHGGRVEDLFGVVLIILKNLVNPAQPFTGLTRFLQDLQDVKT